ncbi:ADP-ribosylation factor-like protein 4A [Tachypleus tridentatus]|uniref:ADP-ribosylation factor-like protein 4A n=1 Tax=Tachypleus tridentatus TaxID=6853 RepID=UPI003FD09A3F
MGQCTLYRLKFDQFLNTIPTIGFNCEKIKWTTGKSRGTRFMFWDVGGQDKLRPLWRSYTRFTNGIVFVLDSVDVERMEKAKMEVLKIRKLWILVLANKQDLPRAKSTHDIEKHLGLKELGSHHLWHIQPACAIIGDGLGQGLEVLYDMIITARQSKKKR